MDSDLCIQYRHLYRDLRPVDAHKTAIKIPFSTFREVIKDHEDFQCDMDKQDGAQSSGGKRKRIIAEFDEELARSKRRLEISQLG